MKAMVLQKNLAQALNSVSRVVSTRATLPVLGNILMDITKAEIKISSTDLEVAVTSTLSGKVEQEGKITIPARLLSDFVMNNSDESIEIEKKELSVNLKSSRYEANIKGIDAEEFPTIPKPNSKIFCSIPAAEFIEALRKVVIAAANDDTRPVLAGVLFKFDGKILTLAATDSYRLAEKKIGLVDSIASKDVIVPSRAVNEVLRVAAGPEEGSKIDLFVEENQIFFRLPGIEIVSRLIEGSFPNYAQIIPQKSKIKIVCSLSEALAAIKMSALFAKDIANNIKVKTEKGGFMVKSAAEQIGDTTSHIPAKCDGGEIEIAFNAKYLLEMMNIISTDEIELGFNDESSPGVIKVPKESDYLYLVMPLKIDA